MTVHSFCGELKIRNIPQLMFASFSECIALLPCVVALT
jgi:hypothetical protein